MEMGLLTTTHIMSHSHSVLRAAMAAAIESMLVELQP